MPGSKVPEENLLEVPEGIEDHHRGGGADGGGRGERGCGSSGGGLVGGTNGGSYTTSMTPMDIDWYH